MRPPDELWSRLRTTDAEFAHTVIESSAIEAEACSSPAGTANHPTRLAQNTKNVFALDSFEAGRAVGVIWRFGRRLQLGKRYLETGTARQDHASLYKVL